MKLNTFIICDLIRQENTKKHILVGVYGDEIIMIPPQELGQLFGIPLAFFIRFSSNEKEVKPESFKFHVSFDAQNSTPWEFKSGFTGSSKNNITIALTVSPMLIPSNATKLAFKIIFLYADGKESAFDLGTIDFSVMEVPTMPKEKT